MARHIFRCPLRWADMDAYGHINNVAFMRYLEEARIDLMFRLAPTSGSASFSGGSVVARAATVRTSSTSRARSAARSSMACSSTVTSS